MIRIKYLKIQDCWKVMRHIFITVFLLMISILFGCETIYGQQRPNIVIITTDEQMADAISYHMGKKWIDTPNMDNLASKGVVFTRAYAANPLCVPSRNSMLTGQYPHTTGIQSNSDLASWWSGSKNNYFTGGKFKSLGTYFRNAGYNTGYFGKWHLNYKMSDTNAHGFETLKNYPKPENDISISLGVDNFLQKNQEKPIMIWASFLNPHDIAQWARFQKLPLGTIGKLPPLIHLPPLKNNLSPPENESEAMTLIRKAYHENRRLFPVGKYSDFDWRRLRWGYYRLVEKVDEQIGRLLTVLKQQGYDKNTLIVFTSDHGESLGAHQFVQKTVFYEESARVPFILKYPEKIQHAENNTLVNTGTDLLPTLLDFANIKKPDTLPGATLKNAVEKNNTLSDRNYIVVENKMVQGGIINGTKPEVIGRMVRGKRYKYSLYDTLSHREALFDLEDDPGEMINIARRESSRPTIVKFRQYLREFAQTHNDTKALNMLKYFDD